MPTKGAFGIIVNSRKELLLVRRNDIPFWDLPGGGVKVNESPTDGLVREIQEETGLTVRPQYLVGSYTKTRFKDIQYIYSVQILDGHLIESGPETKKLHFFDSRHLPINLIPLRRTQIKDYLSNRRQMSKEVKETYLLYLIEKTFSSRKNFQEK